MKRNREDSEEELEVEAHMELGPSCKRRSPKLGTLLEAAQALCMLRYAGAHEPHLQEEEEAEEEEEEDDDVLRAQRQFQQVIHSQKKLFLVLDLDHTLLHTVCLKEAHSHEALRFSYALDNAFHQGVNIADIHEIPEYSLFTKLRPFVQDFLRQASSMFQMYIYTMGTRAYAEAMVRLLDPSRQFIGDRIISREDNVVDGSKTLSKSLEFIRAPASATIILDDLHCVWPNSLPNLIQIDRYDFLDSLNKHAYDLQGPSSLRSLTDESHTNGALARTLNLLRKVHHDFFDDVEANSPQESNIVAELKDVRQILQGLRCELLAGCKLVFFGIFPTDTSYNPKEHPLWWQAEQLGAVCSTTFDDSITHVVTMINTKTEMAKWAACYIVHPRWIEATYLTWKRAAESDYCVMAPVPPSLPHF